MNGENLRKARARDLAERGATLAYLTAPIRLAPQVDRTGRDYAIPFQSERIQHVVRKFKKRRSASEPFELSRRLVAERITKMNDQKIGRPKQVQQLRISVVQGVRTKVTTPIPMFVGIAGPLNRDVSKSAISDNQQCQHWERTLRTTTDGCTGCLRVPQRHTERRRK